MDKASADQLIFEHMVLAERIGQKYAARNNKLQLEAIAEAYYWLVLFFYEFESLYINNPGDCKRILGTFIKRRLIDYFERQDYLERTELKDELIRNTDEEMIEYLSGIMPDESAFKVFHLLQHGVNFFDIEMVDPSVKKTVKRLRMQAVNRLRRIKELKKAGIKVSRDIIGGENACSMEDEGYETSGVSGDSGVGRGIHDTPVTPGKQDQLENDSTVAA
jgi:hypothetical protein